MQDGDEFNKAKAKPKTAVALVTGITGFNYVEKAGAFIKARGGSGAMICQRSTLTKGDYEPIEADLRKWGAWMVYFKRIGRPRAARKFIERQDYQMVPAEWPHLFDTQATIAEDETAANAFVAERSRENNRQFDTQRAIYDTQRAMKSSEFRKSVVKAALGYDPYRKPGPRDFVKPTPVDLDNLELKSPPKPVSDQLKALLRATGYRFPARPEDPDT